MARTKKELKDQAPSEEPIAGEGIAPEGEALRADSAAEQKGISAGSLSDLELAHTGSLDPDALRTGTEAGEMGEMLPESGPKPTPGIEGDASGEPSPQTGFESELHAAPEAGIHKTETEQTTGGQPPEGEPGAGGAALNEAGAAGAVAPPFYMQTSEAADVGQAGEIDPEDPEGGLK